MLERLDQIRVAIARLSTAPQSSSAQAPKDVSALASRALIETKLRERGIPTSTIRQLAVVLEELSLIR